MKRTIALAILLFVAAVSLISAETRAQAQGATTPEATVRRFYQWYLHGLNQHEEPLEKHQAELSKYVTQRLLRSLNRALKRPDGIDADFFLDAQDWDEAWEKNIFTSRATIRGARSNLTVTLKGGSIGEHKLRVGLRKEGGAWKIDSVNGRTNP